MHWADALTPDLVGKLRRLEDVELKTVFSYGRDALEYDKDDPLLCSGWIRSGLTDVIKSFQKHKLKSELTVFRPDYYGSPIHFQSHPDPAWLAEAVREHLLDGKGPA